jgi:predicted  nucleic acid-binding Zn-ribbon protein
MDDEKLERFKEFMVQQQAQSAERIAQMEDLLVRFAQATRERFVANDQRVQELDEKLAALTDAQIRAEDSTAEMKREARERAAELDKKIAALADAHMRTEEVVKRMGERIDNLTLVVERHIADGHGGSARPES